MLYTTPAILLERENFREADQKLGFYTPIFGKITVLGQGLRKIKSKLSPFCQFFADLKITFAKGRMNHLTAVEIKNNFSKIKSGFEKIILAQFLLKIINSFLKPEKSEPKIFNLILATLKSLNQANFKESELLIMASSLKFLSFLGYRPEFKSCVSCRKEILGSQKIFFNFSKGGIVCSSCHKNEKEISNQALQILKQLLFQKFSFFKKNQPKDFEEAKTIVLEILSWQIGEKLKWPTLNL